MEFYKTRIGSKFYTSDLPNLIKSIQDLTKQLEIINQRKEKSQKIEERILRKKLKDLNQNLNTDYANK